MGAVGFCRLSFSICSLSLPFCPSGCPIPMVADSTPLPVPSIPNLPQLFNASMLDLYVCVMPVLHLVHLLGCASSSLVLPHPYACIASCVVKWGRWLMALCIIMFVFYPLSFTFASITLFCTSFLLDLFLLLYAFPHIVHESNFLTPRSSKYLASLEGLVTVTSSHFTQYKYISISSTHVCLDSFHHILPFFFTRLISCLPFFPTNTKRISYPSYLPRRKLSPREWRSRFMKDRSCRLHYE